MLSIENQVKVNGEAMNAENEQLAVNDEMGA
jgi:hypothetical protein